MTASAGQLRRLGIAAVVALAAPGLVTLLAFTNVRTVIPGLLYVVAISAATTAGGRWGGLLAAAASFVPFSYYFVAPTHHAAWADSEGVTALAVFVLTAIFGSETLERQRVARARAERAAAAGRLALETATRLQRVADALASALTPREVLDAVLTEGVEAHGGAGLIATLSDDGAWLEIAAATGYDSRYLDAFERFPVAGDYPLSEAVRTGEGVFLRTEAERDVRYPELAGDRSRPGHGLACLPLTVDRGTIGGLVFSFDSDQEFPPARRALKLALARQAAVALERARLIAAEQRLNERISFLGEATAILASSLDFERTLERIGALAVPTLGDWCAIDLLGSGGEIERLAVAHPDPERARWAQELRRRTRVHVDDSGGVATAIRTGEPVFMPEIPRERLEQAAANPEAAEILAAVELRGWICVPLTVGERTLGALTLVAEHDRLFTHTDFEIAQQLASRAAVAVENARLYRKAEERADAALALSYVGDGVVLLDHAGRVRHWNAAIAAITGVMEEQIVGRRPGELLPAWEELAAQVQLASADAPESARTVTLPFAPGERERWLAVTGVAFDEGVVFALRDVTEERVLERARSDFVATASHELRTPLAAVYGAARTLRRPDLDLLPEQRETFLEIIESETDRLTAIVAQILLAGQLDADRLDVAAASCDLVALGESVLASARLRAPDSIELRLDSAAWNGTPPVAFADEDKLRQVLVNLVDNAIKYSPDGGLVEIMLGQRERWARIAVRDHGLGVPPEARDRIFEKFYRLDPALTRGVGGTGLGLYISRELVTRMDGTLHVEPSPGAGSTFVVELPATT